METLSIIEEGIHSFACMNKTYLMNMGKKRSTPRLEKMEEEVISEESGFHNIVLIKKPPFEFSEKSSKSGDRQNEQ